MVFDSWGGVLADGAFQNSAWPTHRRVLAQLRREPPARASRIVFTKGGGLWLDRSPQPASTDVLAWTGP